MASLQIVRVFEILRIQVHVERGQWLEQRGRIHRHEVGEELHCRREASHPGHDGL